MTYDCEIVTNVFSLLVMYFVLSPVLIVFAGTHNFELGFNLPKELDVQQKSLFNLIKT